MRWRTNCRAGVLDVKGAKKPDGVSWRLRGKLVGDGFRGDEVYLRGLRLGPVGSRFAKPFLFN